jgi:hypothetical protein
LTTGSAIEEWIVPGSPRVTCPIAFPDNRVNSLVLTTATEGMPVEQRANCPNAGDLFYADVTHLKLPKEQLVRLAN